MKQTTILGKQLELKITMRALSNFVGMTGKQDTVLYELFNRLSQETVPSLTQESLIDITAFVYACYESAMYTAKETPISYEEFFNTLEPDDLFEAFAIIIVNRLEKLEAKRLVTQNAM